MLPSKTKADKQPGTLCEAQRAKGSCSEAGRCPRSFLHLPGSREVECGVLYLNPRSRGVWARAAVCPCVHHTRVHAGRHRKHQKDDCCMYACVRAHVPVRV